MHFFFFFSERKREKQVRSMQFWTTKIKVCSFVLLVVTNQDARRGLKVQYFILSESWKEEP